MKVDRVTVWRWENGQQKPEDADVVARLAAVLEVDLEEALAAAGLRPGIAAPTAPTREPDIEIEEIQRSGLPERVKAELIEHVMAQRTRDEQRRIEDLRRMIRLAGGKAS
jgi:transcriptional regulator with XRE-family HTH domain